ncbi:MAG: glycosyltransferase family 39 protein [Saprospiraceae bacterium]|nr:glycosyltransferase family 39 protein [Saprospiraceae bacterium]MCF8250129.1 glycosyltransferase family 39 protein [Saprospiraceae bacterium]MCF8279393.1 glycosyltransferase family 39 protein [Bacteroidales bacterium]MCF8311183.1 glycosyltransferase family 39 protein [Saprospiraceae bacterium]MCF8440436.1 glycosyltransferase family 39 protein [Saprospiraceae bacterium]
MQKTNFQHLALLALTWLAAMIVINPTGNFPLNDDWAYAKDVWYLSQQGILKLDDWPAMTRLTQIFWGAAFCKVFGFSHEVLRYSTMLLGFAGLVATWFIFVEMGASRRLASLGTAVLMFNPIYFSLSASFMTDVPFLALFLWSIYFYLKSASSGEVKHVVWATIFALLATMVRQFGMAAPLAFAVLWLYRQGFNWRSLAIALTPLALCVAAYLGFTKWYEATQGLPEAYGSLDKLVNRFGGKGYYLECLRRIGLLLFFLGFCLSPVTLPLLFRQLRSTSKSLRWWTAGITLLFSVTFFFAWEHYPLGNMVYNLGLGPKTLKDGAIWVNVFPMLSVLTINLARAVGVLLGIVFLLNLVPSVVRGFRTAGKARRQSVFIWTFLVAYCGFLLTELYFLDRYHMVLIPFLLMVLLQGHDFVLGKKQVAIAGLCLVLMAGYAITGTHDYISWNRARWAALHYLTKEKGIKPNQIDGGFEFNGWYKPGPKFNGQWKSWWWVDKDEYVVAFGDIRVFTKEKGFPYERWLPPGVDSIYVLKHD